MGTLTNSEDPDEMLHFAAFHQGLHCLLRQIDLLRKKYCLEIIQLTIPKGEFSCRVLDSRLRGCGLESHRRHWVVSLSKTH